MSKLIIGNLKMNMENVSQRDAYCKELMTEIFTLKTEHEIVVCPPMVYLEYFCRTFQKSSIALGAQDCFWELYGSYTGNTSPKTIQSLGGTYAIIGHSERRDFNQETDDMIVQKAKMAIRVGITPVVCVGFLAHDDEMLSVQQQVGALTEQLSWEELQKTIIAYEPVWAIGSGKTPTTDQIHTMIMYIRSMIAAKHGKDQSSEMRVLYGGSVDAENVTEVCVNAYADGVLVGTSSLSPEKFIRIARMIK